MKKVLLVLGIGLLLSIVVTTLVAVGQGIVLRQVLKHFLLANFLLLKLLNDHLLFLKVLVLTLLRNDLISDLPRFEIFLA